MSEHTYSDDVATPKVSVIIPTLNAGREFGELLRRLHDQTLPPAQIIVIDSGSTDGTVDVARSTEGVELMCIDKSEFNHGTTRNLAATHARGDYLAFMTQDALPANDRYLENLVTVLVDPTIAMASGRQLPRIDARRFERLVRLRNYPETSNVRDKSSVPKLGIKAYFASNVCSIYKREVFEAIGGFAEVPTNEDMLMAARCINHGYRVAYVADAKVIHSHNLSLAEQYKRNALIGKFLNEYAEELGKTREMREGTSLVFEVSGELLRTGHVVEWGAFMLDCVARFAGNRAGGFV